MQPRVNEILKNTYSYNGVEYNDDDNTFHLIQIPISIEDHEWDISEHGQKIISMKMGLEKFAQKRTVRNKKAMTSAIPDIREKEPDFTKLKEQPKFALKQQIPESESEDEDDNNSEDEDSDEDKPLPKITIHPKLLPDGTMAATEAHRLGLKIELVKGDLIAMNPNTKEKYIVTAGK